MREFVAPGFDAADFARTLNALPATLTEVATPVDFFPKIASSFAVAESFARLDTGALFQGVVEAMRPIDASAFFRDVGLAAAQAAQVASEGDEAPRAEKILELG